MRKQYITIGLFAGLLVAPINQMQAQQTAPAPVVAPAAGEAPPVVDPNAAPDVKAAQFLKLQEYRGAQRAKAAKENKPFDPVAMRKGEAKNDEFMGTLEPVRKDISVVDGKLGNLFAYVAKPTQPTKRVVLYLYPGRYVINLKDYGNINKYFIAELAVAASAEVYAIDYRTAPENPFPAALDDAYQSYLALLAKGTDPKNIFIACGSSGGSIGFSLLLKLKDEKKPLPAAVVAMSPAISVGDPGPFDALYLNGHDPKDPYFSAYYGKLEGLPPTLIFAGGLEKKLVDDLTKFVDKAKSAGVDMTLKVDEGMIHIYPVAGGVLPKGKEAIESMGKFINQHAAP
jgi:monoterpene epsilon-lactone hydrolase